MDKIAKKRDRLLVIYDILKIIADKNNSVRFTPLLRTSNLSTNGFLYYYNELVLKGFVKEIVGKDKIKYVTLTDKGFNYLEKYKLILGFIDEFEL